MHWSIIQTKLLLSFYISFIYNVLVAFSSTTNMTMHIYIIFERFVLKTYKTISHLGAMTMSITTLSLTTFDMKHKRLICDTQHNDIQHK